MGLLDFLQSPQNAGLLNAIYPGLGLGAAAGSLMRGDASQPPQPPMPQVPTIAQDQPTGAPPVIAPPDPREGQPLSPIEKQMMASGTGSAPWPLVPPTPFMPSPQPPAAPPTVPLTAAPQSDAAEPIAIGNYKMPRIGSADDFEPDDAIPAKAQQTAGVQPTAGAAPRAPLALAPPPAAADPSFSDHLLKGASGLVGNLYQGPIGALVGGLGGLITGRSTDPAGMAKDQLTKTNNATAQALLAKGVDPATIQGALANPELMKTLITQTFGPQTVQSLGSGYVADKTGKITRAYEPEDKIPAGFVKGDDGNMHFIPGGPADPAYARQLATEGKDAKGNYVLGKGGEVIKNNPDGSVSVVHRNEDTPEPMDPNALEILARREIGGDFSGRKNLGRGAQGNADLKAITNKSAEILTNEMGMTPKEAAAHMMKQQQEYAAQGQGLNAEARTTGVREANLNLILKATDAAIPKALEASDRVARTGWVPLNRIIQGGEVMASDKDLRQFGMANLQLAEHWARAMNPTGVMRGEDRDIALSFLGTADSKETYKALVEQLREQIGRERDAVKSSRGMTGLPGATPAPGASAAPGGTAPPAPNLQPGQSTVFQGFPIKRVN